MYYVLVVHKNYEKYYGFFLEFNHHHNAIEATQKIDNECHNCIAKHYYVSLYYITKDELEIKDVVNVGDDIFELYNTDKLQEFLKNVDEKKFSNDTKTRNLYENFFKQELDDFLDYLDCCNVNDLDTNDYERIIYMLKKCKKKLNL